MEIPSFDERVDLLRIRLRDADAVNPHESHSFKELMLDHADVIADQWYHQVFDVLAALDDAPARVARGDRARLRPSLLAALRGASDQGAGSR